MVNRVLQRPISGWDQSFDGLFKEMVERDRARLELTFTRTLGQRGGVAWLGKALRKDFATNAETFHIVLHGMVQHARSVVVDLAMASVGGQVHWVSVLDGKTTPICRSRSGKI